MARILLTVHKFFPDHRAGTEVLTLKIAEELKRRGHEILIVTANPPDTDARLKPEHASQPPTRDYEVNGIRIHSIEEPLRLKDNKFSHEFYNPLIKQHFEGILAEFEPDLVHVMHAQNLSASIIEAAKEANLRVVLSPTDFWYICPVVQLKRPDGKVCEGPGPGAVKCLTCYTPELFPPEPEFRESVSSRFPNLKEGALGSIATSILYPTYIAYKWIPAARATCERPHAISSIANQADAISVPTKLMKRLMAENGIDDGLIHHIPFGIDTSKLEAYQDKIPSPIFRIGFIGTIYEHKGLDLLIKAFQRLEHFDRCELKVYGSKEQFPEYFKTIEDIVDSDPRTRSRISFLGTFPNDQLGGVLQEIDLLVVPSRWYENTPLVMQSALTTRTPLLATDLGGMSELVEHGKNGYLFPLNDHITLSEILDSLERDRKKLGQLRENIGQQRTIADMVNDLEGLYALEQKVAQGALAVEPTSMTD